LFRESASRKALEEHRLKDEEQKIIERRKQLTALGGAKSAKLMEREIDIATRVLQSMEQNATSSSQEVERLESELHAAKSRVDSLEKEYESVSLESESSLKEIEKNISKLDSTREKHLEKLELR
jgi:predicted  nucleic acid-binding Zn-ribbon protein